MPPPVASSLFHDALHEQLGVWPLAYIPYGGADYGEVVRIAQEVGEGDDGAFHAAWTRAAMRLEGEAASVLARGHDSSARELLLRAACFHGKAYHPLFGEPVDTRLLQSHRAQVSAFQRALSLVASPVTMRRVRCDDASMPVYLLPAAGRENEVRPLLIVTNGYDASITDMYFAWAVAATRRGFHCMIFEGPGQGDVLIEQGIAMRPDWENVVSAVVDHALQSPIVDPARIALAGWSLGGYLAPRAAAGEHRLAACIADPGKRDVVGDFGAFATKLGMPCDIATTRPSELDSSILDPLWNAITHNRKFRWSMVQRGFWVNGSSDLRDHLARIERFTMDGRINDIRCPTLFTLAEDDPLARGTEAFYEELACPKHLIRFTAAEGAGDHCEMGNRSLLNRRVLDWLTETLGVKG
ncbi:alpha/beta hydrolase family protein [Cupriavidus agavae]|uniref:Alpha/beta hydrolase family protein n=1 Tax=Cupriavidus agavae TaxID=1001822 RepID=A0A4Q7RPH1_9BURK|nr:alpha/beta fold hydrolase [Cupriavidus agavae]RZT35513.1 alpha/beta hydrolase family protein [Cupriavidus agavae]